MVLADAADSLEAAGVQPQRRISRRSCGLYAGDQRARESDRVEISLGSGIYAAIGKQIGWHLGDINGRDSVGWDELAGRILRSGNAHGVCVCVQRVCGADWHG